MKIGILTLFHGNNNWGGVLQGYALKTILENRFPNVSVDIINYRSSSNVIYASAVKQAAQYTPTEVLGKAIEKVNARKYRSKMDAVLSERRRLFKEFTSSVSDDIRVYTDANFKELEEVYDCLICGSDQIWNPNVSRPGYFLCGISEKCQKIAYAASIARDSLSKYEQEIMIPLIKKFDYISVREKTTANFLQDYVGEEKKIYEVLDPALMLSADEWENLIEDKGKSDSKYALAFFFSDSLDYRKQILKFCEESKLTLRFIPFAKNNYLKNDESGECERLYDVGPIEFLQLFQNAEYVFTDSFHGCAFSIIFHKQFIVFERSKKKTKTSMNSRLYDLLEKFNLSDRLVSGKDYMKPLNRRIDFTAIDSMLDSYRTISMDFLTEALQRR